MNIKFRSIDIKNFRSIDKAYVTFENQGIVIVKGINEYEEKATSNGSGKSSIFEAIVYALFEETSSGEKDVENRIIGDGFNIKLDFSIDDVEYTIYRESKKGKASVIIYKNNEDISARNKSDTNKLIISLLNISKDIFLDSIFLSQNANTNLASLTPTARKERLEILTNTDETINIFKEKIKNRQLYYESLCVESQANINKLIGNKEALLNQRIDINAKIQTIKDEIERLKQLGDLKEIETEISENQNKLIIFDQDIENINNKIENINNKIEEIRLSGEDNLKKKEDLEIKRQDKRNEYNEKENNINICNKTINYHNSDINRIEKEIESIKNSDTCPTCGRKYDNINEDHINEIINEKNKSINNIHLEIETVNKDISSLNNDLLKIKEEGLNLAKEIEDINLLVEENKSKIQIVELDKNKLLLEKDTKYREKQNIQNLINNLQYKKEQLLKSETSNIEEFENMLTDLDNKINMIDIDINKQQEIYDKNNNYVNTAKHMLQLVTKEFRTYLLKNSLKYLNKLLSEYSSQLFSNENDILKIEENDSKLNINLGIASYESLSGGEKTRANIALLLAQKSLASMIGNMSCNLIVLDEILGYCDGHAETIVIDLITKELESLESIYMVSHKEIPIGYDNELVVIKNKQGLTRIKEY